MGVSTDTQRLSDQIKTVDAEKRARITPISDAAAYGKVAEPVRGN